MTNALIRKIEGFAPLDASDRDILLGLTARTFQIRADQDVIREGDAPRDIQVILEGFAARSKTLPDGSRQIMAYLIAGDFCDLHVAILDEMDHDIITITPCTLARIPRKAVMDITEKHPKLARALWWCTLRRRCANG